MKVNGNPNNIIFGMAIIEVDGTPVGLTRDGGSFNVGKEYKEINADGDRGPVKGRIRDDGTRAKVTVNHLEVLTEIEKLHTGLTKSSTDTKTTLTPTGEIATTDYHTVVLKAQTSAKKNVTITLENAINLENIDWAFQDKNEVIDTVTYVATFEEDGDEPFEIEYYN